MQKVTTLRLAPDILERLQIKAKEQGTNPSNYIRKLIESDLNEISPDLEILISSLNGAITPLLQELLTQAIIQRKLLAVFMKKDCEVPFAEMREMIEKFRFQAIRATKYRKLCQLSGESIAPKRRENTKRNFTYPKAEFP